MLLLASPYPTSGSVVVVNQTSQLVDATLRPVPLSEVYGELHTVIITTSPRPMLLAEVSGLHANL